MPSYLITGTTTIQSTATFVRGPGAPSYWSTSFAPLPDLDRRSQRSTDPGGKRSKKRASMAGPKPQPAALRRR